MTVLQQPPTTKSTSLMAVKRSSCGLRWPTDALLLEDMARYPLGSLTLTGRVQRRGSKNTRCVEARCTICELVFLLFPSNIKRGLTTSCRCQRNMKYGADPRAAVLGKRFSAMHYRCSPTHNCMTKNYGERGIECRFASREEFIRWVLEHLPHPTYRGVEIDRRDNNGHYEPGNLRLVSRTVNNSNKRTSRLVEYRGLHVVARHIWHLMKTDHPEMTFGLEYTNKLLLRGLSPEDILKQPRVGGRVSTTSPTPDPSIVSLYRDV